MLIHDIRHAIRLLALRKGTSFAVVLVLAVGIGLPTVIFALADPFALRSLPYADPDELVIIDTGSQGLSPGAVLPTFDDWEMRKDLFQGLAAFASGPVYLLETPSGRIRFRTTYVTNNFFGVLGGEHSAIGRQVSVLQSDPPSILLTPSGRAILPAEIAKPGTLLRSSIGQSTAVIGGVLQPSFVFPEANHGLVAFKAGQIVTITASPDGQSWSTTNRLSFIGRLQPGVTPTAVQQALGVPLQRGERLAVRVESLPVRITKAVRPLAIGALSASLLIWIVCVGNVANIFMARRTYRSRDFSIRIALGASRLDIVCLIVAELSVIAASAVLLALAMAWAILEASRHIVPSAYLLLGAPQITERVVAFSALAGLAAVLLGLAPVSLIRPVGPRSISTAREFTANRLAKILRFAFAFIQTTLAVVLAGGAVLLASSWLNLTLQKTGYNPAAIYVDVEYPSQRAGALLAADVDETLSRLRGIPGMVASAATNGSVVGDTDSKITVVTSGGKVFVDSANVTPQFFDALGMQILVGRSLTAEDSFWRAVVVNISFVRSYGGGKSLLGGTLTFGGRQATIVGVANDVLAGGLASPTLPTVYDVWQPGPRKLRFVCRIADGSQANAELIRRTIASVNRGVIVGSVNSIRDRFADSIKAQTFATIVLLLFTTSAAVVALAGLVGLVSFIVARRTREIAVRMALGAQPHHIRWLVAGEAMAAAVAGSVVGLFISHWLSRWLEAFVFGVSVGSWPTMLAAALGALAILVLASLMSARRALRLQPIDAMRIE
jgi:putative ABC transport system permease protein